MMILASHRMEITDGCIFSEKVQWQAKAKCSPTDLSKLTYLIDTAALVVHTSKQKRPRVYKKTSFKPEVAEETKKQG